MKSVFDKDYYKCELSEVPLVMDEHQTIKKIGFSLKKNKESKYIKHIS